MAIAYDTQLQLDHLLASGGIDNSVRQAVLEYLKDDFTYPGHTVLVENGDHPSPKFPPTLDPNAQVLYLAGNHENVHTDADLKVIADAASDGTLKVTGSNDVFVAAGQGVDLINLKDATGNDVVMVGGVNSIGGGHGDDGWNGGSDFGSSDGGRGDPRHGGSDFGSSDGGRGDPRHGGSDFGSSDSGRGDPWHSGGDFASIDGGRGDSWHSGRGGDNSWDDGGHYSTLGGGGGNDGWGDGGHDHGGSAGGTTTIVAGSGNDTLDGGKENDLFEVGRHGNDVIDGGGGFNTVQFDDSLSNATIKNDHGVTTVHFSDTKQTVTLTDIQSLVFTDHHGK